MSDPVSPSLFYNVYKTLEPAANIPVIGIIPAAAQGLLAIVETIAGLAILLISAPFRFLAKGCCHEDNSIRKFIDKIFFGGLHEKSWGMAMLDRSLVKIVTLSLARFDFDFS